MRDLRPQPVDGYPSSETTTQTDALRVNTASSIRTIATSKRANTTSASTASLCVKFAQQREFLRLKPHHFLAQLPVPESTKRLHKQLIRAVLELKVVDKS